MSEERKVDDARDAARYRFLREHGHPDADHGLYVGKEGTNSWGKPTTEFLDGQDLDAAIDACLPEKQP